MLPDRDVVYSSAPMVVDPNAEPSAGSVPTAVYEPFRGRIPPVRDYVGRLWARRQLAYQLARTELKGRNLDTFFGQAWNILNPVLLGLVYYLLLTFLQPGSSSGLDRIALLLAGLFAFYFSRSCIALGATSVTGGSGLLLNTSFPTGLLPLSSVISSLFSHASALTVYGIFHVLSGQYLGVNLVYLPLIFLLQLLISTGLALVFATATVYFRDTSSFLPYVLRIWMYLSPVIFLKDRIPETAQQWLQLNPLFAVLAAWQDVLIVGTSPSPYDLLIAAAWGVGLLLIGFIVFIARERDFAFRL